MATLQFKKAKRSQVAIKIGIGGPSGTGKTMSSLLLAYGLLKAEHPEWSDEECWDHICLIDTENGSGSLYTGDTVGETHIGEYNTIDMAPPFTPTSFVDAIHMAEEHGMRVIIIDSLTHAWTGEGGSLDKQGKIASRSGNSYTAWREVTPEHNRLVDTMLQSKCHLIADMRAKMDYEQVKGANGKSQVKAVGMGVQMREGIEYEFTTFFMLDYEHIANATKDRTHMFDGAYFTISPKTGRAFYNWLTTGAPIKKEEKQEAPAVPQPKKAEKKPPVAEPPAAPEMPEPPAEDDSLPFMDDEPTEAAHVTMEQLDKAIRSACAGKTTAEKKEIGEKIKAVAGTGNYMKITDQTIIDKLYEMFQG